MKTISSALLAALESGAVATLIKVTLTNGTVYGYTDHDAPLTVDGQVYVPVAGQSVLKMNLTSDATVSTQDVVAGWTPVLSEQAVLEGLYDFAQVEFALASWGSVSQSYENVVLNDHPVAYWPLNETSGTVANDLSGNGYNMAYQNAPTLGAAAIAPGLGKSVSLNGSNQYVELVSPPSALQLVEGSFEIWCNQSTVVKGAALFCSAFTGGVVSFVIGQGGINNSPPATSNVFGGNYVPNTTGWASTSYTSSLSAGKPYHLIYTNNNGDASLYINGALFGTGTVGAPSPTSNPIYIGCNWVNNLFVTGLLSNAAMYNTALTAAQIQNHYNAGIGDAPQINGGALGSVPIFGGRIGRITYIDKGFTAQAFSNMWSLSQFIGIEFTANCRHKFGANHDPQGVAGCFYNAQGTQFYDSGLTGGASPPTTNTAQLSPPAGLTAAVQNGAGTLTAGSYQYQVTSLSASGESLPTAIVDAVLTGYQGSVSLNWTPLTGATGYNIYRDGQLIGTTKNQNYDGAIVGVIINAVEFYVGINGAVPATPNSPNAPQLSATPVFASTTGGVQYLAPTEGAPYSYSVSAIVDGVESATSPISSIYTTMTLQGLPTFFQSFFNVQLPGNSVGSTITLNWNAVPNATAYNVYGRFNQTLLATVTDTTYTDNGSGSGGTIDPPYGDFFSQGFITMTSGAATGLSREVKFCHSGKLQLWLPFERPVAVGDTFNIQVGCVKTAPACAYKFNNVLNFGGFPGIKPQVLYSTPVSSTGQTVKK